MTELDWATVNKIRALPERERRIYVELAIMQRPIKDVADYNHITIGQAGRIFDEVCRRLEEPTPL